MADIKPFLTIEEQIKRLKERGLIISDENKAACFLESVNYYRFSGYTLTFRTKDIFNNPVSFEHVCQVYKLDSALRGLLLYMLDHVEIAFRTHIAYHHAQKYNPLGYLDVANFDTPKYHQEFIDKFTEDIENGKKLEELIVAHHIDKYEGKFPIWVAVELLSFGKLSKLYKNMRDEDRQAIAKEHYGVHCDYISNWLHGLSVIRNICAHRGRLYNRNMKIKLSLPKYFWSLEVSNNRVFAYIYVLKTLIKDDELWNTFLIRLLDIINKYNEVNIRELGFPSNWLMVLARVK